MKNKEKELRISLDLPEFSYIAKAPNGNEYVAVPVSFSVPEVVYRFLLALVRCNASLFDSPDDVARWIVDGWATRYMRTEHLASEEVSSDD